MINSKTSPSDLARLLGTSHQKLTYLAYSRGLSQFYTTFEIKKKNGGERTINAPIPQLKIIQKRLKSHLEKLYKPHVAASAFIEGRGICYNAKKHTRKAAVLNIDLKDFYDHINFGRVRGLLIAKPYELRDDTATLIAHLCCLHGHLPQGSPASPLISNMICRSLDHQLSKLAKEERSFYTRYADDITFSFRELTQNNLFEIKNKGELKPKIITTIEKNGFKINQSKTRVQFSDQRQTVTGLKVNQKVNIDRRFVRTTKAMIHSLSIDPIAANIRFQEIHGDDSSKLEHVVFGRVNYIGMIKGRTSSTYRTLASKFNDLDFAMKAPLSPKSIKDDLEHKLKFKKFENYGLLENTTYVVSFEGINGLKLDEELVQGTAFVLKGNRIITASHSFDKAGNPDECFLYKINDPSKKLRARIKNRCTYSDIAYLEFIDNDIGDLSYLKVAKSLHLLPGYHVSLVGFPQLRSGHRSVSIIPSIIVNKFMKSTFQHLEVNNEISGGNSGGPVVNAYMEVVGMVTTGKNVIIDKDENSAEIEGTNAFISAEHFKL
tara:strand:+ start:4220 stop:5860 length:1641 start_codon:yes stop_codon:yes gene_type:complete